MTSDEAVHAELCARHAVRAAEKLARSGAVLDGPGALRMFAAALRAGAHLRPAGSYEEAEARQVAIVGDLIKQAVKP